MSKNTERKQVHEKEIPEWEISYYTGKPERGCELIVFDKKGNPRSTLKLVEASARFMRDSLNQYLGETGA